MELFKALRTRRSIRAYQDTPVPREKLLQVLEAARIAPSASNSQLWKFVVVEDKELRKKLVPACRNQKFVGQAGAVIVCCTTDKSWKWSKVDVAIAIDHMTLAAHAEGLGSCWIGAFTPDDVREIVNIPTEAEIVALLTLGVPDQEGRLRPRKELDEIVSYNRY